MSMTGARPAKALALTGVLFLLLGSGLGFAEAAGDERSQFVPAPGPGDSATYQAVEVRPPTNVDPLPGPLRITYTWGDQAIVLAEDLSRRTANELRTEVFYDGQLAWVRSTYYDAATGDVIGAVRSAEWDFSPGCITMCPSGLTNVHQDGELAIMYYTGQVGPCGMLTPIHGTVPSAAAVDLFGHCGYADAPDTTRFDVDGLTLTAQDDPGITLVYEDGSPFPAEANVPLSELFNAYWGEGRLFHLEKISEQSQGLAFAAGVAQTGARMVDVGFAPRTPWGLDDTGADHPFLLSDAYQAVLADDEEPRLVDWLAGHPDAYMAEAWSIERIDRAGNPHNVWFLIWSDGADVFTKRVTQGPMAVAAFSIQGAPRETIVENWVRDDIAEGDYHYPSPDRIPAQLPLAKDVLEIYRRAEDPSRLPDQTNRYGLGHYCNDDACEEPYMQIVGGYFDGPPDTSGEIGAGWFEITQAYVFPPETRYSQVAVDEDGVLLYTERAQYRTAPRPLGMDLSEMQPQEASEPPAAAQKAWSPPGAAATAGAGFLAILFGALYYFWPALKTLPGIGLFSRIAHDKVLDNERRREIMDVVEAEPGIHFQEISRRTGLGRGALDHHLRKLAQAGLIIPKISAGYTCYFPKGVDRRVMATAGAVKSAGARKVLDAVIAGQGASLRQAAGEAGLAPSTASHHMSRLVEAGLVEKTRNGYKATNLARHA